MFRKAVSLLLIFTLSLHCLSRLGILAYFELNRDYIAKVLCINREKPQLRCNGKCYLAKKLQAQQEREHKTTAVVQQVEEIILFCQSPFIIPGVPGHAELLDRSHSYLLKAYSSHLTRLDHPPRMEKHLM